VRSSCLCAPSLFCINPEKTGFRVLSKEEEKKFLASATPYIQDIALFALNTGLRIGEILSLKWEGVDNSTPKLSLNAPLKAVASYT
jgi:integrase